MKILKLLLLSLLLLASPASGAEFVSAVAPDLNGCFKPSISGSTLTASANRCDTVPIYSGSGSRFDIISSIDLTKTLSGLTVDSRYDIFIRRSGTGLALALGPAWTSSTSRGTGGGTTELVKQNGIYVNANAITGECGVKLCTYIATFLATSTTSGEIISGEYENLVVSGRFQPPRGTYSQLPTSPKDNDRFTVTDCATSTCDTGGGDESIKRELRYDAELAAWVVWAGESGVVGQTGGLQAAADVDRKIHSAVDVDSCVEIGNEINPFCMYTDSLNRPTFDTKLPSDREILIRTGFVACFRDETTGQCILTLNPALSGNARYVWGSSHKPTKTITLTADALYMQGCTLVTDQALVTGGLIEPYITCGADNAHGFHRSLPMPDDWDGGTIAITLHLINVHASPANDYEVDFSAEAVPVGTAMGTTINTTGEQPATIDFDASGSCGGSACSQFDPVKATTAAIIVNGTPAGGNILRVQGQIDAAATTTAQVADIKIHSITIAYRVMQGF